MTTYYDKIGWRAILMALAILFAVIGAIYAKSKDEPEEEIHEGETGNEVPITIQADSKQQKQDSVFAAIDESFKLVKPIFEQNCFDCHSASTDYPWYHKVPGVKQLIDGDIKEGREHLDFTDGFPFAGKHTPLEQLADIKEETSEGKMPPLSYRLMHWGAWLSSAEKDSIAEWVDSSTVMLTRFYDSQNMPYKKGPVAEQATEHEH